MRTFVAPFDPVVVRQALRREHERGGQSFVVCPRIRDLEPMRERLAGLVPELDLVVAHGRMKSERLDEVVVGFAEGAHDVLLCTDIIEAGLDIPNANTILVWQADRFGLAQLHQLRGRVGRGRRQAVAYLLTDPQAGPGAAAEQRLRALQALEGLGAGFAIGARDLDLRGAGDLLGADQAGHLRLIGTTLYQRLLEQALRRAKGEPATDEAPPDVNLGLAAAIPPEYVPEEVVRIGLYRRLAELQSEADIEEFSEELADRFGPPPTALTCLLEIAAIRVRCRRLGLMRLEAGPKGVALTFREADTARRFAAMRVEDDGFRWREDRLVAAHPSAGPEERLLAVGRVLDRLEDAAGSQSRPA